MSKVCLQIIGIISLTLAFGGAALSEEGTLKYPCYLLDVYDADDSCWEGVDANGPLLVPVVPEQLLVGPPPSDVSFVTFPPDHWVELSFPGRLIDGPGNDIIIIEIGQAGEQALVFVTDGAGQEYLLDIATASDSGGQTPTTPTVIGLDIAGISFPFVPCALRVLAIDNKGDSPGFDIGSVCARTCLNCGKIACNPYPPNSAENVAPDTVLTWSPGNSAEKHTVYFGTSINDVDANATAVSNPPQPQDADSFDPGCLELGESYYWRVDEVNYASANSPWVGDIWHFTVADHIVMDDFESYNDGDNKIYNTWTPTGYTTVFLATSPVHRCGQSMALDYYYDDYFYSEATRRFSSAQDWACAGVNVLELFFHGKADNRTNGLMMYIAIGDGDVNTVVLYDGDPNNIKRESWQVWRIDLQKLAGVNLSNVTNISIGMCLGITEPSGYGWGRVYFDDIMLYPSRCLEANRPAADFTGDCAVDLEDLEEMAYSWLDTRYNVYAVTAPRAPLAWYKFDGGAQDSTGNAHGDPQGNPAYVPGVYGQAIRFDGYKDSVVITDAAGLFSRISSQITIAFWQYGDDSPHLTDTVCCSNYVYGVAGPAIAINLGCWRKPSRYNWDAGFPWSFGGRLSRNHRYKSEWAGRWNHWAFAKNCEAGPNSRGLMQIFLNGVLYDSRMDANSPVSGVSSFVIGSGWYGGYDGLIDDFRIYDYALSQPEVAYVATNGTGILEQPLMSPADLSSDGRINFKDFAILADKWLNERLWP
jgi:hypothetical protein